MKHARYTKEQLHKMKHRAVMGFLATFLLLCSCVGALVAKYYAGHGNKGVATASGLYFTSNVLKNVNGKAESEYPVIYNTDAWDGTNACELKVQVRNYQNQLLYNDRNLDVVYNVTFQLIDTSDGGNYSVTYKKGDNTETTEITDQGVTVSDMKLQGGMAIFDLFTVKVQRPDAQSGNSNYRSVGIRVTATPVSPSYVANSYTLGGVLYATMVSSQYSLTHSFSRVTQPLEEYAGFPYTITYMPGENSVAQTITVTWDESLEVDQFNEYYNQAKQDNAVQNGSDGTRSMKITIQPYSSIQIAFYRGTGFRAATITELEELVKVRDSSLEGSETNE